MKSDRTPGYEITRLWEEYQKAREALNRARRRLELGLKLDDAGRLGLGIDAVVDEALQASIEAVRGYYAVRRVLNADTPRERVIELKRFETESEALGIPIPERLDFESLQIWRHPRAGSRAIPSCVATYDWSLRRWDRGYQAPFRPFELRRTVAGGSQFLGGFETVAAACRADIYDFTGDTIEVWELREPGSPGRDTLRLTYDWQQEAWLPPGKPPKPKAKTHVLGKPDKPKKGGKKGGKKKW